jgi:hypothetical protein
MNLRVNEGTGLEGWDGYTAAGCRESSAVVVVAIATAERGRAAVNKMKESTLAAGHIVAESISTAHHIWDHTAAADSDSSETATHNPAAADAAAGNRERSLASSMVADEGAGGGKQMPKMDS